jgi:hypothetical protein
MSPEEALRRAENARQVFEQPIVKQTLDFMEQEIMGLWTATPIRDIEAREALWRMAVTTRKFRDLLRGTMESGTLAADQIQRKKSALEKGAAVVRNAFTSRR